MKLSIAQETTFNLHDCNSLAVYYKLTEHKISTALA